jgi:hypothetical protein
MATTPMGGELLLWVEIGRAAPGNEPWAAWIAENGPDTTLYRCLILVAGTAFVTIDLQRGGSAQMQRLHAGQCALPPERQAGQASIAGLLEGADRATRHALHKGCGASRAA